MRPRAPCWLQFAAFLFLWTCACATVPPPVPACEIGVEDVRALVTRAVADACTSRKTDDLLLAHTDFLLRACHESISRCLRLVCIRLDKEDGEDPYREVRR